MPEDVVFDDERRRMPTPGVNLMKNPFPKPKIKRKKRRVISVKKPRRDLIIDF